MTMTAAPDAFEQAFQEVQKLAATFDANKTHYLSSGYQEQEARQDFIDKFWTALGWDVTHTTQTNPYAQEVKVERSVTMSEGKKRADYAFYLDPDFKNPRFFVEAPRRPGDPAELVATSAKIEKELGWKPQYGDLPTMMRTAYEWFEKHPKGYEG